MKKLPGTFNVINKMTEEQIQKWSQELMIILKKSIEEEAKHVEEYVNQ